MFKEFSKIKREAHAKGLVVIAWVYPRGKGVKGKSSKELMAYAARTGLEIGVDIIKIKYDGKVADLKWAVKNAGKTKVVIAGGVKKNERELLRQVREIVDAGAIGLAIGRNIWQNKKPLEITKKIKEKYPKYQCEIKLRNKKTPASIGILMPLEFFIFNKNNMNN